MNELFLKCKEGRNLYFIVENFKQSLRSFITIRTKSQRLLRYILGAIENVKD